MKCLFCSQPIVSGTGKMFVKTAGEIIYFCSSKCQKNHFMGRGSKKLKWAKKK